MHKILIPTYIFTTALERKLFTNLINCFYKTQSEYGILKLDKEIDIIIVETSSSLGKDPIITFLKEYKQESCFFIKNDVLFRKYIDTGIVEKLGKCKIDENFCYKLVNT